MRWSPLAIILSILAAVVQALQSREDWISDKVDEYHKQWPNDTVVLCNVLYTVTGAKTVTDITTIKYGHNVGHKITFDVVIFSTGSVFQRQGDGGAINWQFILGVGCTRDGAQITCV